MNMGNHVSFVCKGFSFDSFLIFEFVFRFIFDIFWISDRVNRSTFGIFNNHISQYNFYVKIKCKIKTLVLFFAHRPYDLFCSNASLTPIISESIPRLAELEYNINHHYESLTTTSPTVTQSGTDLNEVT